MTTTTPTAARRWFAFRLRTLFVLVAILALPLAWVAYSLNWIRERMEIPEAAAIETPSLTPSRFAGRFQDIPPKPIQQKP